MPFVKTVNADGSVSEVEVSDEIASFMEKNDRDWDAIEKNDEYLRVVHFDKQAWENMHQLSDGFSAEDECLGVPEDTRIAEDKFYRNRRAHYRIILSRAKAACTTIQWQRLRKNKLLKHSIRKIAADEGRSRNAIAESLDAAMKKIKYFSSKEQ